MNNVIELTPYLPPQNFLGAKRSVLRAVCTVISTVLEGVVTIALGFGMLAALVIFIAML